MLLGFPLKTSSQLDSIEASLDLLEIFLSLHDYFAQKKQKVDLLQASNVGEFLLILIDQIKKKISSSQLGGKSQSYWKGADSTAQWIKDQWTENESSFIRNLIVKRDSLLIHIDYNIKIRDPQGTLNRIYPELSLNLAFDRIRKGWEAEP